MTITAYVFSKKLKSTKTPGSGVTSKTISAALKEPTSVLRPSFRFTGTSWDSNYNYVKATLGGKERLYRVTEARHITADLMEIDCDEDYMGTWGADVKSSTQFIERSSDSTLYTHSYNGHIIDMAYPAVAGSFFQKVTLSNVFDAEDGYFVLGIIGENIYTGVQRGLVKYVVLTTSEYNDLQQELNSLTYSAADKNPLDYIVCCYYVPFTFTAADFQTHSSTWSLGSYSVGPMSYYGFSSSNPTGLIPVYYNSIALPDHTFASRGKYMNFEPWLRYHIFAGPFGDFDLPTDQLSGDNNRTIDVYIAIDVCTGEGALHIMQGGRLIIAMTTQLCTPVLMTQISSNSLMQQYQVATHLASSLSAAIGFHAGASASEMGAAVMSSYAAGIPKIQSLGSNGSLAGLYDPGIHLMSLELTPTAEDLDHIGRPVMEQSILSGISSGSFVKTRNATLTIPAFRTEIEELERMMDAGFYIE